MHHICCTVRIESEEGSVDRSWRAFARCWPTRHTRAVLVHHRRGARRADESTSPLDSIFPGTATAIASASVLFLLGFAYLRYAFEGWFFLDDFGYVDRFHSALRLEELLHPVGFGRFLSTNVYWNLTWRVFGGEASLYFACNLVIIVATAWIFAALVGDRYGRASALVAGLCYAALPNVISAYGWISNAQHLVAHLFCAMFLYLYFRWSRNDVSGTSIAALEAVLVAALLSNQLSSGLLIVPVVHLLADRDARRQRRRRAFVVLMAATVFILYLRTRGVASGPYALDVTTKTMFDVVPVYFGEIWVFWLWIATSLTGFAVAVWRRHDAVHATLWLGGVAFVAPFLFLKYQHYPQYASLGLAMFFMAVWISAYQLTCARAPKFLSVVMAVFVLAGGAWGLSMFSPMLEQPDGARQREFVAQMAAINETAGPEARHFCFDSERSAGAPRTDAEAIPYDWQGLGFGVAFHYFVDPSKTYEPMSAAAQCNRIIRFHGRTLTEGGA